MSVRLKATETACKLFVFDKVVFHGAWSANSKTSFFKYSVKSSAEGRWYQPALSH